MRLPEMNAATTFYLGQIQTMSNAVTAFALAQNVSAIFAFFSNEKIGMYIFHSDARLIYPVIVGGIGAYVGLVYLGLCMELRVLQPFENATANRTAKGLAIARAVLILVTGIGLVLATMAIKNPDAAGKADPTAAPASRSAK